MIEVRRLTEAGLRAFELWLTTHAAGAVPPADLIDSPEFTEQLADAAVDESLIFNSRFEFGSYLVMQLGTSKKEDYLSPAADGLWAWLTVVYFEQLGAKKKRIEHYVVQRRGHRGSLAYRHGARTSYELVAIHGAAAQVCLSGPMHTFGELTEQFASRQTVVRNRAFFRVAGHIYVVGGRLRRGAGSKPKSPKQRPPGDRTGFGSSRRLGVALKRLDLTWDTEEMGATQLVSVLPKEFRGFGRSATA